MLTKGILKAKIEGWREPPPNLRVLNSTVNACSSYWPTLPKPDIAF